MLPEQKKKPRKHRVFKALMAEAVGFEPTCPCGQLHFECSSLQPLRYASMYKYSLLGTNHMISSQSRYDHFDTAPYLSQHQHLGKRGELMGRTSKNIKLRIPEKPHKIKGFRSGSYRVATTISSAAPSTTRTTLRVYFRPVFFPEICSKIRWRENRRDGKKYSILRFSVLRNIKENQGDEIPSFCRNFESVPL